MARILYSSKELALFWQWINERHLIWCKRQAGEPWPWTHDKVLRTYKFTNVFRQLDRVTQEWTRCYRILLNDRYSDGDILFWLCVFRFFNWPETYHLLAGNMNSWNFRHACKLIARHKRLGKQLFTGAYIISSGGERQEKYITICEALEHVYRRKYELAAEIREHRSMQHATLCLQEFNTVGPFVAYEIACDLRHTRMLFNATDIMTWANAGPGAIRGIHRLLTGRFQKPKDMTIDYNAVMIDLLKRSKMQLQPHVRDCEWPFELREIEHSLCEFDKMRRVMRKEGTPRSRYHPPTSKESV